MSPDSTLFIFASDSKKIARIYDYNKNLIKEVIFNGTNVSISNNRSFVLVENFILENLLSRSKLKFYDSTGSFVRDTILNNIIGVKFINNNKLILSLNANLRSYFRENDQGNITIFDDRFRLRISKSVFTPFRFKLRPYFDTINQEYVIPTVKCENQQTTTKIYKFSSTMERVQ